MASLPTALLYSALEGCRDGVEPTATLLENDMTGILTGRAIVTLAVSLALAAGAAGLSSAADQGPRPLPANPQAQAPQDRNAPPAPGLGRNDGRAGANARARDRLDRRLDYLHRTIGITQAQEQLWRNFADAVRAEQGAGGPRPGVGRGQGPGRGPGFGGGGERQAPSVVERLEQRQQRLTDESNDVNQLLSALRPLYGALTAEQKRLADENLFHPERERFAGFGRFGRFGRDGFGRDGFGRFGGPRDGFGPPDDFYR
jgi:LTXXQ motif family protein